MKDIQNSLILIGEKIKKAALLYGRNPSEISLIAVTKTVEKERIIQAINHGQRIFGENYIQEAQEKWPNLKEEFPQIELHFIGHLQSNKASEAVKLFDVIETLDSEKLARELKKECVKQNKNPEIFIQVNIGEEAQKGGIDPQKLAEFVKFSRDDLGLRITGLMCIPPTNESTAPYFALLAKLAKKNNLLKLSMGMSGDFEEAIALQTTHIRIGSKIFGERK